jgi:hypothetical protein
MSDHTFRPRSHRNEINFSPRRRHGINLQKRRIPRLLRILGKMKKRNLSKAAMKPRRRPR